MLINPNQKEWEEKEIEFLRINYINMSRKELAKSLSRTESSIQCKMRRLGLKKESVYHYDKDFFNKIDTEEKAYWLGFIYADGYIVYNEKSRNYEVSIELSSKDKEHLKKFNKSINGNIEVVDSERECFGKMFTASSIRLYSKEMTTDLMNNKIVQNKTHSGIYPNILELEEHLIIHFIRGFFDGDGCITISNKKHGYIRMDFTSINECILKDIRNYLFEKYNIKSSIHEEKIVGISKEIRYRLCFYGKYNTFNFGNLMYNDSNIFLDRKYNLFKRMTKDI